MTGNHLVNQTDGNGDKHYYLHNGHGDVVAVTDVSGIVEKRYEYNAYGESYETGVELRNPLKYFGQYFDEETGEYYLRARYYSPVSMRFVSEDTYSGVSGDSLSLNRYLYVSGNPVRYVDPSGFSNEDAQESDRTVLNGIWDGLKEIPGDVVEGFRFIASLKDKEVRKEALDNLVDVATMSTEEKAQLWDNAIQDDYDYAKFATKLIVGSFAEEKISGKLNDVMFADDVASIGLADDLTDVVVNLDPSDIRFSQTSVNGSQDVIESMAKNGWDGAPIDVVRMSDGGLTTIDNTRVVAAREVGIDVEAVIHNYDDLLPTDLIERFTTKKGTPTTWGDALELRIGKQNFAFRSNNPYGSLEMEMIK